MLERTEKRWPSDAFSYKERRGWTRVSGAIAPRCHWKRDYRISQNQKFKSVICAARNSAHLRLVRDFSSADDVRPQHRIFYRSFEVVARPEEPHSTNDKPVAPVWPQTPRIAEARKLPKPRLRPLLMREHASCGFRKFWPVNSGNSGTIWRGRQVLLPI